MKIKTSLAVLAIAILAGCGGGGGAGTSNGSAHESPTSNAAPVASAVSILSVVVGTTVTLDGTASSDADGDALSYSWTLTSKPTGSTAALHAATTARPTFVADAAGAYTASLVVNDGKVDSGAVTVTVTVASNNAAPVAVVGSAQNVLTGTTVFLDGSASTDANGDTLTYKWEIVSKPTGSSAALLGDTFARPVFTADMAGSYVVKLTVNDGQLDSEPATITVTATNATAANSVPAANAGLPRSVVVGSTVNLDGSASTDADGDPLTYAWSMTSKPAGSMANLAGATGAHPSFVADVAGLYIASLVVSDGKDSSQAVTVTTTAAVANAAPVANAGPAQTVSQGAWVTLDGSASTDADGDALTYSWTVKSFPGAIAPSLFGSTPFPTFIASTPGVYVISLVVDDGKASSAAANVTVTVANGVGATPSGTGLVIGNLNNLFVIDEATMTKSIDFSCGHLFWGIDRAPDGVLLGVDSSALWEVNPVTGACVARGNTPEWLIAMAVSPAGQIYAVSFQDFLDTTGGSFVDYRKLYTLSSSGAAQSSVNLSGYAPFVTALAFAPDGQMYGVGIHGAGYDLIRIDPATGVTTFVATPPVHADGDIDIDSNNVVRAVSGGELVKWDLQSGVLLSHATIDGATSSQHAVVFVP